ncbi:MAG: hypothetical protein ACFFDN_31495 [Candidatus Hodarchaeota archaeon]
MKLDERADFFSYKYNKKYINIDNSQLIYGSEIEGAISTILSVPNIYVKKELLIEFEAESIYPWDYRYMEKSCLSNHLEVFNPTEYIRIEVFIDYELVEIASVSSIPKEFYSNDYQYRELKYRNNSNTLGCIFHFCKDSSRKSIEFRFITNHSLNNQKIFSEYFIDNNYVLTLSYGSPEIIRNIICCIINIICFFSIVFVYIKKKHDKLLSLYSFCKSHLYLEFSDKLSKNQISIYKKMERNAKRLLFRKIKI